LTQNSQYNSFLLRFRSFQNDGSPTWIVSLQNAQTGEQLYFSSLNGFIQYLQANFSSGLQIKPANPAAPLEALLDQSVVEQTGQ
jgi:hypothetical protein